MLVSSAFLTLCNPGTCQLLIAHDDNFYNLYPNVHSTVKET